LTRTLAANIPRKLRRQSPCRDHRKAAAGPSSGKLRVPRPPRRKSRTSPSTNKPIGCTSSASGPRRPDRPPRYAARNPQRVDTELNTLTEHAGLARDARQNVGQHAPSQRAACWHGHCSNAVRASSQHGRNYQGNCTGEDQRHQDLEASYGMPRGSPAAAGRDDRARARSLSGLRRPAGDPRHHGQRGRSAGRLPGLLARPGAQPGRSRDRQLQRGGGPIGGGGRLGRHRRGRRGEHLLREDLRRGRGRARRLAARDRRLRRRVPWLALRDRRP